MAIAMLAAAPTANAGIWIIYKGWGEPNLCAGQYARGPAYPYYDYMSKNHVQTNGGGWDIGFTRQNGTYQNTGTIVTTDYTLNHSAVGLAAFAWHQNKNSLCIGTMGRYLSYP